MIFQSIRLAQKKAALVSGAHSKVKFEEVAGVVILSDFEKTVINRMSPPKELIEHWMLDWKKQKAYKFKNKKGDEVRVVIKPEVDGYSCWLLDANGIACEIKSNTVPA